MVELQIRGKSEVFGCYAAVPKSFVYAESRSFDFDGMEDLFFFLLDAEIACFQLAVCRFF